MREKEYIALETICLYHEVSDVFVMALFDSSLIDIVEMQQTKYIYQDQLSQLEKFIRWHNELQMDTEAIAVVNDLVERINTMQEEMDVLKKQLSLYEPYYE